MWCDSLHAKMSEKFKKQKLIYSSHCLNLIKKSRININFSDYFV